MKNLTALRFFICCLVIFFVSFYFIGKAHASSELFFSDNNWNVYDSDPFSNPNAFLFGNAEEVIWPGPTNYPGILNEAKWIWAPGIANSTAPADLTEYYFSKKFIVNENEIINKSELTIVADDLADIYVNGYSVGSHGSITDVTQSGNTPKNFIITSFIKPGGNIITIRVQNGPSWFSGVVCSPCIWNQNLAGVIFSGYIDHDVYQKNLSVPILKQTSNPWQSQIYDSANKWSSIPTINSWGCALTSAAMVLNYHGINKLPDSTPLDPGTLNTWLKNQKDGYIGNGFVNWLSLSRLSKLAKTVNGITNFDALEYTRTGSADKDKLANDINNSIPDILEEPGHFIVGKGIDNEEYKINDPFYDRTSLNDYSNSFISMGTYTPSNTDLSYIMFAVNPEVMLELKDVDGNILGSSFIQEPIIDDKNPTMNNSKMKIFYFQKPDNKNYQLYLYSTANTIYNLDFYLYDINGNVQTTEVKGLLGPEKKDNYIINFNKQASDASKSYKLATFQTLINDIKEANKLNLIKPQIANDLVRFTERVQRDYGRNKRIGKIELTVMQTILNAIRKTPLIKETSYQIILYDVTYLKNNL